MTLKIFTQVKNGQMYCKNNHFAIFVKVQSKPLMHSVCTLKDSFSKDFKDSLSQNKLNFERLKKKFREWDHGWGFFEGSK